MREGLKATAIFFILLLATTGLIMLACPNDNSKEEEQLLDYLAERYPRCSYVVKTDNEEDGEFLVLVNCVEESYALLCRFNKTGSCMEHDKVEVGNER